MCYFLVFVKNDLQVSKANTELNFWKSRKIKRLDFGCNFYIFQPGCTKIASKECLIPNVKVLVKGFLSFAFVWP